MPHPIQVRYRLLILAVSACGIFGQDATKTSRAEDKPNRQAVGDAAADFELQSLDGKKVQLSKLTAEGPVVVMVLRGYPGYQCPLCTVQVGQFLSKAKAFEEAKTRVVMIYPGPADELKKRAEEFISGKTIPANFQLVIDPDYTFTKAWNLRWDARRETAYPSTFVVDAKGKIQFAKISMTHGGRAGVDDVLKAVTK